jgi:hypothetical protein
MPSDLAGDRRARDADAVRYIVLRKLASGLRHSLMGELQSIQFLAELSARLLPNRSDEARLRDCVEKIPHAAAAAITTCHSVIEWLRPEEGATTSLGDAVAQCVRLAGDDWKMRSTVATVELPREAGDTLVSKAAARELVVTSLLVVTDLHRGALDIAVDARPLEGAVELSLRASLSKRSPALAPMIVYQPLAWDDIAILADVHGVTCRCDDGVITLRFAAAAPAPQRQAL